MPVTCPQNMVIAENRNIQDTKFFVKDFIFGAYQTVNRVGEMKLQIVVAIYCRMREANIYRVYTKEWCNFKS